jgi:Skp family chaperone for outer membrane proteins
VKKTHLLAVSAAGLLSLMFLAPLFSQGTGARPQAAPGAGSRVAMVDFNNVFKNHNRFKALRDQMRNEIDQAEVRVRSQNAEIQKLVEKLKTLKVGSPDYTELEEKVQTQRAMLQIDMRKQQKDFVLNEARIYHDVYKEIEEELNYLCQRYAIDVVLRINSDKMDATNPDSVMMYISRPVVWHNPQLDITQAVIDALNRSNPAPAGNNTIGRPPAAPNTIPFK